MNDITINLDASGVKAGAKVVKISYDTILKSSENLVKSSELLQQALDKSAKTSSSNSSKVKDLSKEYEVLNTNIGKLKKGLIDAETFQLKYGKAISAVKKEIKDSYGENNKALESWKKTSKAIKDYNNNVARTKSIVENTFKNGAAELKKMEKATLDAQKAQEKYNKSIVANEFKRGAAALKELNKAAQEAEKAQTSLNKTSSAFTGIVKTIKAATLGYATVLATMKISEFISDTVKIGVELESLKNTYTAITGSSEGMRREFEFVKKAANDLGLNFRSLRESYKGILAASQNTVLAGEDLRNLFIAVSKASTVLGMSVDETNGTFKAFAQMISKGNVQAEELRGQLGERLYGAFQMAAEAMDVSTQKLNDMLENGEVLATDLLPKIISVLEDRFAVGAVNASESARAAFNRFSNAVDELKENIINGGLLEFFAELAKASTYIINLLNRTSGKLTLEQELDAIKNKIREIEGEASKTFSFEDISKAFNSWLNSTNTAVKKTTEAQAKEIIKTGDLGFRTKKEALDILNKYEMDLLQKQHEENTNLTLKNLQDQLTAGAKYDEDRARRIKEVNEFINTQMLDDLGERTAAEVAAERKKFAQILKLTKDLPNERERVEKALQNEITKIHKKAADQRYAIFVQETKKRLAEYEKLKDALEQSLKPGEEQTPKVIALQTELNKTIEDYEKKYGKAFKAIKNINEDIIEQLNKELNVQKELNELISKREALQKKFDNFFNKTTLSKYDNERIKAKEIYDELLQIEKDLSIAKGESYEKFLQRKAELDKKYAEIRSTIDSEEFEEARKKELAEYKKAQEQKLREYKKFVKKVEKKTSDFFKDLFTGEIDSFKDFTDSMKDIFFTMLADMAAKAIAEPIIVPIIQSVIGTSTSGGISAISQLGGTETTGTGSLSLLSNAQSLYSGLTGNISTSVGNLLSNGVIGNLGQTIFGAGTWGTAAAPVYATTTSGGLIATNTPGVAAGGLSTTTGSGIVGNLATSAPYAIAGSLGYTYLGGALGLPQSEYSGATSGVGAGAGAAIGAKIGSGYPVIGTIVGAIVGGLAGSLFGDDEPDPRIGIRTPGHGGRGMSVSEFGYQSFLQDLDEDVRYAVGPAINEYFDNVFTSVDELIGGNLSDILAQKKFDIRVDPSDYDSFEEAIAELSNKVFKKFSTELVSEVVDPEIADEFDKKFFENIATDGETAFDTFLRFGDTVQNTSNFMEKFETQMYTFGLSAEEAYANIEIINTTLTDIQTGINSLSISEFNANLASLIIEWDTLLAVLEVSKATVEELEQVEKARNITLGATISGLNAQVVQDIIKSGGDIGDTISNSIFEVLSANLAESIVQDYITPLNEEIGKAFFESGGDIESIINLLEEFDTTPIQEQISQLQDRFKDISNEISDVSDEITNFNTSIQDIIDSNTLSDYEIKLLNLNSWYETQLVTANELGISLDNLNKAYELQASVIQNDLMQSLANLQINISETIGEDIDIKTILTSYGINSEEIATAISELLKDGLTSTELKGSISLFRELGLESDNLNNVIGYLITTFEEASSKASAIALQQANFDIRIMELEGDAVGALAKSRELELATLDESLHASQLRIWALEDAITAEQEQTKALSDLESVLSTNLNQAINDYRSALQAELDVVLELQSEIENNLIAAKENYINAINREIQAQEEAIAASEDMLSQLESVANQISEMLDDLLISEYTPLLPDEILKEAFSKFNEAGPEDLPQAAGDLLEAARAALTDPEEYARIFEEVQNRLGSALEEAETQIGLVEKQIRLAQLQVESLEQQINDLEEINNQLLSMEDAEEEYRIALANFEEDKWAAQIKYYEDELDKLDNITDSTYSVKEALDRYQYAITAAIQMGYENLSENFRQQLANIQGFASGGIATGPTTGYLATLHGTELITPITDTYTSVSNQSENIPNDDVVDLLKILIGEIREDKENSRKINRTLDRVTAGANSFQTRAED